MNSYTPSELAHVFWSLFCYCIYLVIRWIFHLADAITFHLKSSAASKKPSLTDSTLVSEVLVRYTRDVYDFAKPEHFLTKRLYYSRPEDVITPENDRIVIYCLDRQYVTFIELPKPISEYSTSTTPFVWLAFFRDARRVIRVPVADLHPLAARFGDPELPIVLLWNSGRCGSTLLSKLVTTANPRILALSEPDLFTSLHLIISDNKDDAKKDTELIRSCFRIFFRRVPNVDGYLIKPRMFSISLLPYIHDVMPKIKHALLYRRNIMDVVRSYERSFRPIQDVKLYYMAANSHIMPLIDVALKESPVVIKAVEESGLQTTLFELMSRIWANGWVSFVKYKDFFEGSIFPYEDFMQDPVRVLEILFGLLNMVKPNADDVREWMKPDAQAATPMARDVVKKSDKMLTPVDSDPELQKRVNKFVELVAAVGDF